MRGDNHYQLQIPTLSLISLSYHIQHSLNLYNKAQFHQAIKMRGDNPTLTTDPNTSLHIFVISYPTFFKPSQQGIFWYHLSPINWTRNLFFLTGLYYMETFCMVVLGGEYVTTYCWGPGVPTRLYLWYSKDTTRESLGIHVLETKILVQCMGLYRCEKGFPHYTWSPFATKLKRRLPIKMDFGVI